MHNAALATCTWKESASARATPRQRHGSERQQTKDIQMQCANLELCVEAVRVLHAAPPRLKVGSAKQQGKETRPGFTC